MFHCVLGRRFGYVHYCAQGKKRTEKSQRIGIQAQLRRAGESLRSNRLQIRFHPAAQIPHPTTNSIKGFYSKLSKFRFFQVQICHILLFQVKICPHFRVRPKFWFLLVKICQNLSKFECWTEILVSYSQNSSKFCFF